MGHSIAAIVPALSYTRVVGGDNMIVQQYASVIFIYSHSRPRQHDNTTTRQHNRDRDFPTTALYTACTTPPDDNTVGCMSTSFQHWRQIYRFQAVLLAATTRLYDNLLEAHGIVLSSRGWLVAYSVNNIL